MIICFDQRTHIGCGAQNDDSSLRCGTCGRPLRFALPLHNKGAILGQRYRIERMIGYGGFGAVYEAIDLHNTEIHVAIKETFDHNSIRHFRREFNVLKEHSHDNLPRYYDVFEAEDFDENGYLVMEYVPGQSLEDVLNKEQSPLLESQVLGYALQLCDVLNYLHSQTPPIIHRDIKPANIRLTPSGLIKLVDFGLLKAGDQQKRSTVRGATPAYSPYEQFGSGGADHRSDIYSLGATLYQLLTAREPVPALDRLDANPDPLKPPHYYNHRISPYVSDAIMKAMRVFQRDRYSHVMEMKQDLLKTSSNGNGQRSIAVGSLRTTIPYDHQLPMTKFHHPTPNMVTVKLEGWEKELTTWNREFGQADGYWCFVRPGTYRVGGWDNWQKVSDINIPEFWIGRFPVTVRHYASFARVGYDDEAEKWWTPHGWKWKQEQECIQPWGWDDPQYNTADQPVIGISWYEAVAFTNWMTDQLSSLLKDGYVFRLPTEAEWEAAAAYDDSMTRHIYPWGNKSLTPQRAVYDESGIHRTALVGTCTDGAAACGAEDMVGNIWEWAASSYAEYPPEHNQGRTDFAVNDWDVSLRGGAWDNNQIHIRCSARFWAKPGNRNNYWGLRIVRALPL